MCEINFEEDNYGSDTGRIIKKFDIYLCDLGEGELFTSGGDIGKTRPCVIISSDNYNNPKSCRYIVAPIRTEHKETITKENLEDFVNMKKEIGTLYVPLEMKPDDIRFIDITEIKKVASCKLVRYISSILNPVVKDSINKTLCGLLFSNEELNLTTKTKKGNVNSHKEINKPNTANSPKIENDKNESFSNDDKLNTLLDKIYDDEMSIEDVVKSSGIGEPSVMFFLKEKRRKESINIVETKLFNRLYTEWQSQIITAKEAAKELGISYTNFYRYANKIKNNSLLTK